jgi:hypothetical protein
MIDNLVTIFSPQPLEQTLSDTRKAVQEATEKGTPIIENLNQSISEHLTTNYDQFQVLQTTPDGSGDLADKWDAWDATQRDFLHHATLSLKRSEQVTKKVTLTWTKQQWSNLMKVQSTKGEDVPGFRENLLTRDELEELDQAFRSIYTSSDCLLSASPESIRKAKKYRDEVVTALQRLQLKYQEDQDPLPIYWTGVAERAYMVLSPLPGRPIPLPLPTESAQKSLYKELQEYSTSIRGVSPLLHIYCVSILAKQL